MLPEKLLQQHGYNEIAEKTAQTSGVTTSGVNFVFRQSGEKIGFPAGLYYYVPDQALTQEEYIAWDRIEPDNDDRDLRHYLFSFGSMRQKDLVEGRSISFLTVTGGIPFHWFDEWADSTVETRPKEYIDWLNGFLVARARRALYSLFPEAKQWEVLAEPFTPLDIRDRHGFAGGSYCGSVPSLKISKPRLTIPNLWLVGKDQKGCGVQLSALSGILGGMDVLGVPMEDPVESYKRE